MNQSSSMCSQPGKGNIGVGVVGLGFVGQALHDSLKDKGANVIGYDKYKNGGIGQPEDLLKAGILFLCLPTPYKDAIKRYDQSAIDETCLFLAKSEYSGLVILKSTVSAGTCQLLADRHPELKIGHNPEFLTARTARQDVDQQSHVVLGFTRQLAPTSDGMSPEWKRLVEFLADYYPTAQISVVSTAESEAMKLFVNNFYAVKIQIFNEFYLFCQKIGANFPTTVDLMLKNGWINPMHTQVPGPDGQLSYGGMCFPKDTQALLGQLIATDSPHAVLEACVQEQKDFRDQEG